MVQDEVSKGCGKRIKEKMMMRGQMIWFFAKQKRTRTSKTEWRKKKKSLDTSKWNWKFARLSEMNSNNNNNNNIEGKKRERKNNKTVGTKSTTIDVREREEGVKGTNNKLHKLAFPLGRIERVKKQNEWRAKEKFIKEKQ